MFNYKRLLFWIFFLLFLFGFIVVLAFNFPDIEIFLYPNRGYFEQFHKGSLEIGGFNLNDSGLGYVPVEPHKICIKADVGCLTMSIFGQGRGFPYNCMWMTDSASTRVGFNRSKRGS